MDDKELEELGIDLTVPADQEPETEVSLEDIMKEFGAELPEEPAAEAPGETSEDMDVTRIMETVEQVRQEPVPEGEDAATQVFSDTIRLDKLRSGEEPLRSGQVRDAEPVEEPAEEEPAPEPAEEKPAFEGDWEPEYEQPMGEYVPAPPVIVHPRSRLRELKKKLIAGPEKMYYDLLEQGVGGIQLAMLLCVVVVTASVALTVLYSMGMVAEGRLRLVVFCQFLALLLCALLGSGQLIEGLADLGKKRFTLNTLLTVTFAVCCVDGVFGLMEQRISCCAAFGLEMCMCLWSAYHRRSTRMGQLDTMRKATRLDKISACPDYLEGKKGLLRGEGQVEDFMDTFDKVSPPEKVLNVYGVAAMVAAAAAGVAAGWLYGLSTGFRIAAVTLLAAVPATAYIAVTRPMAVLERRLHALGAVLCGWQGVKGLCGKALFPLSHGDLFPGGTVRMNGVKFFGQRQTDQVVEYASALVEADGGALEPLFTQLLESRNGAHYSVENFVSYGDGGIGGEVCGEPVLVGTLSFLKRMGVEIPDGLRVSSAVCVAVDGELCGLFALNYDKTRDAASGLVTLTGYRGLRPVLVCSDFMLTGGFLSGIFGVRQKKLVQPEMDVRQQLREKTPAADSPALALSTKLGLAPFAYSVTGARALRTACILGVILHMLGGILGIGVVVTMTVLGTLHYLTPLHMFLYQLVWIAPALLITEWTRSV